MRIRRDNPLLLAVIGFAVTAAAVAARTDERSRSAGAASARLAVDPSR